MNFIPEHQTNILPLRWIANYIFEPIAGKFLNIGLKVYFKYEDQFDENEDFEPPFFDRMLIKICSHLYNILDIPYKKWGTYYVMRYNR